MSCVRYPLPLTESCCLPYELTQEDEIRRCVYAELFRMIEPRMDAWCGAVDFGSKGLNTLTAFMTDADALANLVMRIWQHRQADANAASGADRGLAYYWATYKLSMVMRYWKCTYGLSIDPMLLQAGLVDPARVWTGDALPVPQACALVTVPPYVPPVPPDPADAQLVVTVTPQSTCSAQTWHLLVNVTLNSGCQGTAIDVIVDGVVVDTRAVTMGTTNIGEFDYASVVSLQFTNSLNPVCDQTFGPYTDPRFPDFDIEVFEAQDAAYETSAVPGEAYLVLSDLLPSANTWATHVGEVWDGAGWVVPNDGDIIKARNPLGPSSYYQIVAGVPVPMFPAGVFPYNTISQTWLATPPAVPPYTAALDVTVGYECAGTFHVVYDGPFSGFVPTGFTTASGCDFDLTLPYIRYNTACPIPVAVIPDPYTPNNPQELPTVGLDGGVNSSWQGPNGSVYVGGFFNFWDKLGAQQAVANSFTRLNADMTLDTTFNAVANDMGASTPGFNADLRDLAVDAQGRIVCVGSFTTFNDASCPRIVRINQDGTLDTTFVIGTGFNSTVNKVSIQVDGKIVLTGAFVTYNGTSARRIVRLNDDGSIDAGFLANMNTAFDSAAYRNEIDVDGTIIVNSGQPSFDVYNDLNGAHSCLNPVATRTLMRINPTGLFDSVIAQGLQFNGPAPTQNSFAIQQDGQIVCVGAFTTYNGVTVNRICRISATGVLDAAFLANTGTGFDAETTGIAIMPNGQILIGCNAGTTFNGSPTGGLVRLNADGTRDNALNIGTGFNAVVIDISITTFGDTILGGNFTTLNGLPAFRVAKI